MSRESLEKAREAKQAQAAQGTLVRLDPVAKAKLNPKSLRRSVNAKCWDCCGAGADSGTRNAIGNCTVTRCPLWSVRPYQHLFRDVPPDQALR